MKSKSVFELLCNALEDFTLRILIFCSFLSIILEVSTAADDEKPTSWIEGFAIFVAVVVCATVQAVNDYQKESQFQKLNSVADKQKQVTAIRSGKAVNLHNSLVLVGDLIQIYEGMEIPADGYIIEAADINVDESAMTGETDPIKKHVLAESIKRRDQIIEEGARSTVANHDIFSPVLLSGTRVRYF